MSVQTWKTVISVFSNSGINILLPLLIARLNDRLMMCMTFSISILFVARTMIFKPLLCCKSQEYERADSLEFVN